MDNSINASGAKYSNALLNMEDVVIVLQQMNERITELETNVQELATEVQRLEQQAGKPAARRRNPQQERLDVPKGRTVQDLPVLTTEQQRLFDRAVKAGLMERLPDGRYHWLASKALLSYFCGRVFCGDRPMVGCDVKAVWEFGSGTFPAKLVEEMLGVKGRDNYRRKRKMERLPPEHRAVDDLFL